MEDACEQMIITTNSVRHDDHGYITKNLRSGHYVNMQQMCLPWLFTFLSSCMVSCCVGLAIGYWRAWSPNLKLGLLKPFTGNYTVTKGYMCNATNAFPYPINIGTRDVGSNPENGRQ